METKKFFKNVTFDEASHTYTIDGKQAGISTTGLIEEYCKPFIEEEVAPFSAKKHGKTVNKILDEWHYKRDYSCSRGNEIHLYAQGLWSGIPYATDYSKIKLRFLKQLEYELPILQKQALSFYNDYKNSYEFIEEEQFLYDADYAVAGSIDLLLKNKNTGEYAIVDFKSYGELRKKAYNKFLIPLHKFEDNNTNHLSFQLEVYKQIFERETKLVVGEMFGVYFNIGIDDYEIIEVNNMEVEIKKILNLRRAKVMAKMLMIIGDGGVGKTSSLRNLDSKEHFYIDCDKKGLNYKGWKKDYKENENYFKTNDGEVVTKALLKISEEKPEIKYITVDTINSIMIADEMRRAKDKNYDKWTDLAACVFWIIAKVPDLRDDLTVIFIGHTQTEDDGSVRLLTNGKKLNKIGLEKYFNTVLLAKCNDGKYVFETRSNNSTARTPFGAFDELEINNDIVKVLEVIKEY